MAEMTGIGPAPKLELAHSLPMPGCQSAPGVVAAQWVLDQMTGGGGSEGNSCLYLLVIVANHNAHNSWAYPVMIVSDVIQTGYYCSQRITMVKSK